MNARYKDVNWNVGGCDVPERQINPTMEGAQLAVLMDLRDELKGIRSYLASISSTLSCRDFQGLPRAVNAIRKNIERRKPKQAVKKS